MNRTGMKTAFELLKLTQIDAKSEGVSAQEFAGACFAYAASLTQTVSGPEAVVTSAQRIVDHASGGADG